MATIDNEILEKVQNAVSQFNNSPWIVEGEELNVQIEIEKAVVYGVDSVLEKIRRADIRLYHMDEARNGMI